MATNGIRSATDGRCWDAEPGNDPGLPFRLTLAWSLAGGLGVEMVLVVAVILRGTGDMMHAHPVVATLYFGVGAAVGFLHGGVLSVVGRPKGMSVRRALKGIACAALAWAVLAIPTWGAALGISLTSPALSSGHTGLALLAAAGWGGALCIGSWALLEMMEGLAHALDRWPGRRPGIVLITMVFMAMLTFCMSARPEIWFTDLRVTAVGALFLSLGATVWLGIPLVVLMLAALHPKASIQQARQG